MSQGTIIDVRPVPPRERHPLILNTYEALGSDETFELVNDHDPKPLYYQFAAEYLGAFSWEYMETGPDVWRVRIGKSTKPAATPPASPAKKGSCCS